MIIHTYIPYIYKLLCLFGKNHPFINQLSNKYFHEPQTAAPRNQPQHPQVSLFLIIPLSGTSKCAYYLPMPETGAKSTFLSQAWYVDYKIHQFHKVASDDITCACFFLSHRRSPLYFFFSIPLHFSFPKISTLTSKLASYLITKYLKQKLK